MQGIFDVWLFARPRAALHRFAAFGAATSPAKSAAALSARPALKPEAAIRLSAVTGMLIAAWFLYFAGDG
jgi:HD superfamily phosphodiesterase